MTTTVNDLFNQAQDEGNLSQTSIQALTVMDIGAEIEAGLGVKVDNVETSEVTLVTVMPDDSASIRFGSNAQLVRDGHNLVLEALGDSKQKDGILVHNRYLNGKILYPYCTLDQAVKMDNKNYDPNQGTPLYDNTILLLGTVLAKWQDYENNGITVRTTTLIITDGADCGSKRGTPQMVASIVRDMLKTEQHIIMAMGIDDGGTDFKQVFKEMGIRDEWILTPNNTASEIRKAFAVFSRSAVIASQSAANFKALNAGGFGG
jgi:hypothetical protein